MVRAMRKTGVSGFYHIVMRGAGHCLIFEDDCDRTRFLETLDAQLGQPSLRLHAWCLMSNHVHLLVEADMHLLSEAMRRLDSSYAIYFNKRHERIGPLFQGRFKSEPVDTDAYFLTALRYIHQNPQKAGIANSCDYPWSSFSEFVGRPVRTDTAKALAMLGGIEGFIAFHEQDDPAAPCIDIDRGRKLIGDDEALEVARRALDGTTAGSVSSLGREARDDALRQLKAANLSIRQIERLTGVSRSVVAKACRGQ